MRLPTIITASATALSAVAGNFTPYVDPFIGTGAIDGGLAGNNHPAATMPFGMVQPGPDTHVAPDWYNASGYNYNDTEIFGFTHTRLSGTGASDLIDLSLFPTTTDRRSSRFSHEREHAAPGIYSVDLLDEGITASLSATRRVGIHKYIFPKGESCNLIIDLERSANKESWGRRIVNAQIRQVSPNSIAGYRIITGWAKLRKVYFYIEFSAPIRTLTLTDGDRREDGAKVINGSALSAKAGFGEMSELICKVGISPVSIDNARLNLSTEAPGWNFNEYVKNADREWDRMLGMIEVEADDDTKTTFYTALYHTLVQPNLFSDANGEYMGADYSVRRKDYGDEYTTFSLWDTYRAAHPLYTLLYPNVAGDFVNSMLDHYDAYGYLPIWQLWGQDNYCMIGNHAIPVAVDAAIKKIPGVDAGRVWDAVYASSTQSHPNSPWAVWEKYGYMPETLQTQSVSITLEEAFDDWCVALLADKLGKRNEKERFSRRAGFYANLFDPASGFFRPKDENGEWIKPFDPLRHGANGGYPFTEGNAWQYLWYVPHNIPALVEMLGGKDAFEKKLDSFFSITDKSGNKNDNISGEIGQYAHGNEPSHHVAYLYNYAGKPEKTRAIVQRIAREMYNNLSSGYAGNDDCGEMSAWYIFSALGFYPVNPAGGEYQLGVPLVTKATLHIPGGNDFTVNKSGTGNTVTLNGKTTDGTAISHSDILAGGTLEFK